MESLEHFTTCPYCWQSISISVDTSLSQTYIEDCEVCCQPISFAIRVSEGEVVSVEAERAQ